MDTVTAESPHRAAELMGMLMIGDAVLGLLHPAEHCRVWQGGPGWWRETLEWFADHPDVTRAVAIAELGAGLYLASQAEAPEPVPLAVRYS